MRKSSSHFSPQNNLKDRKALDAWWFQYGRDLLGVPMQFTISRDSIDWASTARWEQVALESINPVHLLASGQRLAFGLPPARTLRADTGSGTYRTVRTTTWRTVHSSLIITDKPPIKRTPRFAHQVRMSDKPLCTLHLPPLKYPQRRVHGPRQFVSRCWWSLVWTGWY